jgi:hypothetical protein
MTAKEKKTAAELSALVMEEIRKLPELNDVTGAAITRPTNMNWDVGFTMHGPRYAPEKAWAIARDLQAKYDLA